MDMMPVDINLVMIADMYHHHADLDMDSRDEEVIHVVPDMVNTGENISAVVLVFAVLTDIMIEVTDLVADMVVGTEVGTEVDTEEDTEEDTAVVTTVADTAADMDMDIATMTPKDISGMKIFSADQDLPTEGDTPEVEATLLGEMTSGENIYLWKMLQLYLAVKEKEKSRPQTPIKEKIMQNAQILEANI